MEPEPPVAPSADASRAAAEDEDESKEKLLHIPFRELECALCLKSLFDPVTTPECGHTFCRACLSRAVREKPNCPLCRHPLCKMDPKVEGRGDNRAEGGEKDKVRDILCSLLKVRYRRLVMRALTGGDRRFVIMTGPDEGVGCFVKIESSRSTADGRFYIDGKATHRCNVTNISYEEGEFGLQVGEAKIAEDRLLASSSSSSSPSSPSSSSLSSSSQPPQSSAPSSAPPSIQSPPEDSTDEKKRLDEIVNNVMQEVGRYQRAVGSVEYSRITRENGEPPRDDPAALSWWVCRSTTGLEDLRSTCLGIDGVIARLHLCHQVLKLAAKDAKRHSNVSSGIVLAIITVAVAYCFHEFGYITY